MWVSGWIAGEIAHPILSSHVSASIRKLETEWATNISVWPPDTRTVKNGKAGGLGDVSWGVSACACYNDASKLAETKNSTEVICHVMDPDKWFIQSRCQSHSGVGSYGKAPWHAWASCEGDTVNFAHRHVGIFERCLDYKRLWECVLKPFGQRGKGCIVRRTIFRRCERIATMG
jgi:hypothetical protein